MTVETLKATIQAMTATILTEVRAGELDAVDVKVDQRMHLLQELIAASPANITPEALSAFLKTILEQDETIARLAMAEQANLAKAMHNVTHLQQYLNV